MKPAQPNKQKTPSHTSQGRKNQNNPPPKKKKTEKTDAHSRPSKHQDHQKHTTAGQQ